MTGTGLESAKHLEIVSLRPKTPQSWEVACIQKTSSPLIVGSRKQYSLQISHALLGGAVGGASKRVWVSSLFDNDDNVDASGERLGESDDRLKNLLDLT